MTKDSVDIDGGLVRIEVKQAVAIVRLNRPERKNALNASLVSGLCQAARYLRDRDDVKAVILTGGDSVFSAGGDLGMFRALQDAPTPVAARRMAEEGNRMCAEWSSLPQPTIAAIEGPAIGGGLSIALCCDWRVMAEGAWVHVPEVRLGLNFGWNTLPRMTALVGPARAKTIALLARRHQAAECVAWGLADTLAEPGMALASALDMAQEVCAAPILAARLIKQSITRQSESLMMATSHRDPDDLVLALQDEEGSAAREEIINSLKEKKT
ncbi:MAG: enoyl-CoA hydratase/isomerase family protein [Silicimonas sp.]